MSPSPAHFPKPLVGLMPDLLEMLDQLSLEIPGGVARSQSHSTRLVKRIEQLAIDVELQLVGGSVADPHRCGVFITPKPPDFLFGQPPFSGDPVHDLHLHGRARDCTQQPIAPGCCLFQKTRVQ